MSENLGVSIPFIDAHTAQEALADEREYVLHAWSVQRDFNSPTIVGGEGSWFWDIDGKRYLDFGSQAMSNNAGHQHPRIVQAITEQAHQLCYAMASFGTLPRSQLAKKLAQIAPGNLKKSFFTTGGSEANENAIKIARYYTGKRKIITRWRSYHGATAASMTASGDPRRWPMEPGVDGIVRALDTYCYRCPFSLTYPDCGVHCVEHIADLIKMEGNNVAAVMLEPVVGSNGLLVPPDEYLPRLREICSEHNILLIADEVMSGFGRTGQWFACQNWEVVPDIVTVAKGLTSASVPLGAVIVSEEIADYFEDKPLSCGLTYFGHPLACAAALGTIAAYEEEGLIEHGRAMGNYLLERLGELQAKHPSIGEVRGVGLFTAIELVKDRDGTCEPLTHPIQVIQRQAMDRGLFVNARDNFFLITPPLVITREELEHGLAILDELLALADCEVQTGA